MLSGSEFQIFGEKYLREFNPLIVVVVLSSENILVL